MVKLSKKHLKEIQSESESEYYSSSDESNVSDSSSNGDSDSSLIVDDVLKENLKIVFCFLFILANIISGINCK